jgi:hypothetical protein
MWIRGRLRLKCDGTRAETRFRLSAKRTSPFKSAGASVQSTTAAEVCTSAVVMLDPPCSEVVWRVLATHYICQFPLHFPSRASPCAITFQLDSTARRWVADFAFRRYLPNTRLRWPQNRSERSVEEKNLLLHPGIESSAQVVYNVITYYGSKTQIQCTKSNGGQVRPAFPLRS